MVHRALSVVLVFIVIIVIPAMIDSETRFLL